jgi:hypothetical protein
MSCAPDNAESGVCLTTEDLLKVLARMPQAERQRFIDVLTRDRLRARNRGRDPATLEQDRAIHELRNSDPRTWPWKKLGRHFGMGESGARAAYNRHTHILESEKRTN